MCFNSQFLIFFFYQRPIVVMADLIGEEVVWKSLASLETVDVDGLLNDENEYVFC